MVPKTVTNGNGHIPSTPVKTEKGDITITPLVAGGNFWVFIGEFHQFWEGFPAVCQVLRGCLRFYHLGWSSGAWGMGLEGFPTWGCLVGDRKGERGATGRDGAIGGSAGGSGIEERVFQQCWREFSTRGWPKKADVDYFLASS